MRYPKRPNKTGKPGRIKGLKAVRKRKFQPVIETGSEIKVRSQYEKICVAWLTRNKIDFQYEPLILIKGRQFRPDFFLPEQNLFLEICGYNHMPFYRNRVAEKKALYEKYGMKAVFIECNDKRSLIDDLEAKLSF